MPLKGIRGTYIYICVYLYIDICICIDWDLGSTVYTYMYTCVQIAAYRGR